MSTTYINLFHKIININSPSWKHFPCFISETSFGTESFSSIVGYMCLEIRYLFPEHVIKYEVNYAGKK